MINGEITIENDEYVGDFNLDLTINTGQTSQMPWINHNKTYYENITLDDEPVVIALRQDKLNDPLYVKYFSNKSINEDLLHDKLFYIFDLNYPMDEFRKFLKEDGMLSDTFKFNRGLRLFKAHNVFESIISSILSANNSIKRWTKTIHEIRKNHGPAYLVNDVKYPAFPDEKTFIKIPEENLKTYGSGYRSSQMLETTSMILKKPDFHNEIFNMNYTDAFNELNKLSGVGPKVADCILLYGYGKYESFPTDVWINRIMSYLYFNSQKISNKKITSYAQDKYGIYSGYVQLYLFNYARKSGLLSQLKK